VSGASIAGPHRRAGQHEMSEISSHATVTVSLEDAEERSSVLVERAAAGEEIVIEKAGMPRARLVSVPGASVARRRLGGFLRGQIRVGDDFDDPLPDDILRAFNGEAD
jgi:antitoxin (DNA-binding transcriptional repressor) of toxin-antitoxin stability system